MRRFMRRRQPRPKPEQPIWDNAHTRIMRVVLACNRRLTAADHRTLGVYLQSPANSFRDTILALNNRRDKENLEYKPVECRIHSYRTVPSDESGYLLGVCFLPRYVRTNSYDALLPELVEACIENKEVLPSRPLPLRVALNSMLELKAEVERLMPSPSLCIRVAVIKLDHLVVGMYLKYNHWQNSNCWVPE